MPWGVAAGVVSAGAGLYGSSQAAKGQQNAANAAQAAQQQQFDRQQANQQPWIDAGTNALQQLLTKAGQYGTPPTAASVMADPGYKFATDQGIAALQQGAVAGGHGLDSGAVGKALVKYGQGNATKFYDDAFNRQQATQGADWNRYAGLAGIGQSASNQLGAAGASFANNSGMIGIGNAGAQGAAGVAQGNIWGNLAGQVGNTGGKVDWGKVGGTIGGWFGGANTAGTYGGGDYNYGGMESGWADGGPVRAEPVVGTKAPMRAGGTGGGLSNNALLTLLVQQQLAKAPSGAYGVGALPGDPLLAPQIVLDERLRNAGAYAHGGAVHGPGGPRTDSIPARLSDGEHVMDAASVNAIGGGNNEVGQQKLNKLRMLLKQGAAHGV
jgi:hypothetical protein